MKTASPAQPASAPRRKPFALAGLTGWLTLMLLTGCESVQRDSLTCRVWSEPSSTKWIVPAMDPHLALFADPTGREFLVQYDAIAQTTSGLKRRCYQLYRNQSRVEVRRKPEFVSLSHVEGLKPVPVFEGEPDTAQLQAAGPVYVVTCPMRHEFTLYGGMAPITTHKLPVYPKGELKVGRVAETPFAVTGDTILIGVVATGATAIGAATGW